MTENGTRKRRMKKSLLIASALLLSGCTARVSEGDVPHSEFMAVMEMGQGTSHYMVYEDERTGCWYISDDASITPYLDAHGKPKCGKTEGGDGDERSDREGETGE